jgi:hypothetical protein
MTENHPIKLTPELVNALCNDPALNWIRRLELAYQAGADCELEKCCEWLKSEGHEYEHEALLAARRPKPPSLKEQALEIVGGTPVNSAGLCSYEDVEIIRRALEQLDD